TPGHAYRSTPKAVPAGSSHPVHYRIRYDHVGTNGKISFRRAGRMHHLGVGYEHRGARILAIADEHTVTVVRLDTGEVIATNDIDPTRTYWRNNQKAPADGQGLPR
ncbi:IS481 family transposase, partial [Diaminobutyricibacter tongyongensis]|nr:IS481 family transposase [Diaminobutyricibacter tongyongensis]